MAELANWMEVVISEDGLKAALLLRARNEILPYTVEEIVKELRRAGIKTGVMEEVIADMIKRRLYRKHYLVAQGEPAKPGKDGYFEYFFNTNAQTGIPKILSNGRVDYSQIIALVKKDQVLVEYHRAIKGTVGYKVTGEVIQPPAAAEEDPLGCAGVIREGDLYKAAFDGRVTLQGRSLEVDPALVVDGSVNMAYGNVDFNGDVFIRGDVNSGMEVKATGSIIIDGTVEAAKLFSEKDIIVGYGIHGEDDALIEVKGKLACNFLERVKVVAGGKVMSGSIVHCEIYTDDQVEATQGKGIIMGGIICGMTGVTANIIGHRSNLPTQIYVGASPKDTELIVKLQKSIRACLTYGTRLDEEEKELDLNRTKGRDIEAEKRKVEIIKERIQLNNNLGKSNWALDELLKKIAYAEGSVVIVHKMLYAGAEITIGTIKADKLDGIAGAKFMQDGIQVIVEPFEESDKKQ